ncbi:hypothetical protein TeGR_g2741 [Tetraparma gracilis]|uniref:Uncharacterized protein n=1 Tax=Tetraparma gracilis TaxID=2962635 RepID=A0ABQ6MC21_9STRA|nr:hypothetical protein TeGR_g2741 [Tetraparma gracilis]
MADIEKESEREPTDLEQLTKKLQSESEPERLAAVTELATQADQRDVDDAVHIPMMRQEGLMAAVVKISKADGDDAQAQAFMAVTRIARAVAIARSLLAFPGLVDSAISTTKTSTGLARQWACTSLVNISNASSNHHDMASNAPLFSTLVALAKDESAGEARAKAIRCIAKLAGSASTASILLGADILPTMMDVVRKADSDLSKWGKGNSSESWALIFLMNIAQADAAVPVLRVKKIYDLLAPLATQDAYEALKACATLAFVVGGEEGGPVFELLKRSPAATGQLVDLLKNTLLCIDTKGKGVGYLYGVYPLHSSLNAVKVLSHSDGFKGYLLSKEVFPLLHRVLAEFVENRGGGMAGGGGDDIECACIAIFALFELSHPPSSSSSSATASLDYALSTVATYSDASLTPLLSLLPSFIEKATAAVGLVFYDPTPAIATAESLLTRLTAGTTTVVLAKVKSKLVRQQSLRPASSEPEKKEESAARAEIAAQLLEAEQQLKARREQLEKQKLELEAEKKALADRIASQQADIAAETQHLAEIWESKQAAREQARDAEYNRQMQTLMAMMSEMKTVAVETRERTNSVLEGQAKILTMSAATQKLVKESTSKVSSAGRAKKISPLQLFP